MNMMVTIRVARSSTSSMYAHSHNEHCSVTTTTRRQRRDSNSTSCARLAGAQCASTTVQVYGTAPTLQHLRLTLVTFMIGGSCETTQPATRYDCNTCSIARGGDSHADNWMRGSKAPEATSAQDTADGLKWLPLKWSEDHIISIVRVPSHWISHSDCHASHAIHSEVLTPQLQAVVVHLPCTTNTPELSAATP